MSDERKQRPEDIRMTPDDFDRLAIAIMRAHCLAERLRTNQATDMASASKIDEEAAAFANGLGDVFSGNDGPEREERAKALGWPSADALTVFLFDGASVGPVQ